MIDEEKKKVLEMTRYAKKLSNIYGMNTTEETIIETLLVKEKSEITDFINAVLKNPDIADLLTEKTYAICRLSPEPARIFFCMLREIFRLSSLNPNIRNMLTETLKNVGVEIRTARTLLLRIREF